MTNNELYQYIHNKRIVVWRYREKLIIVNIVPRSGQDYVEGHVDMNYTFPSGLDVILLYKDYGKTWALQPGELEKGN